MIADAGGTEAARSACPAQETSCSGSSSPGWASARRILCVRTDQLGDVLMTTPALRALKEAGRHVTLLTSSAAAGLGSYLPSVDEVIAYDAPWVKRAGGGGGVPEERILSVIRDGRYDGAVIFTTYTQSPLPAALVCRLAGVPLRAATCREHPYDLLTDRCPEYEPERFVRHEAERQLSLVASLGFRAPSDDSLEFRVPAEARAEAARVLEDSGVAGRKYVVLHPGATAASRAYPPDRFRRVAEDVAGATGMPVLVTGLASEATLVDAVAGHGTPGVIPLAGRFSLAGFAALLEKASLLVAGNCGPVHVAAAVGTPVADVYALTNPQHTPWRVPSVVLSHDVPCRNCYSCECRAGHHRCLTGVPAGDVTAAALRLLGVADTRRPARPKLPVVPEEALAARPVRRPVPAAALAAAAAVWPSARGR